MPTFRSSKKDAAAGRKKSVFWEYFQAILMAVILAMFIRTFVVQAFKIPSGSMLETLQIGDFLLVNKFVYGLKVPFTDTIFLPIKSPKQGDIVVFEYPRDPSKDYIKRVVGVAGDTVEIRDKQVLINGQPIREPYVRHIDSTNLPASATGRDNFGPVTIKEGRIFVMGDNREESYDSRFWGTVAVNKVVGKAFIIYWSWDPRTMSVRWSRLLDVVH